MEKVIKDPLLNSEERLLKKSVREFVEEEIKPEAHDWARDGHFPRSMLKRFGEFGWLGIGFPEEVGGSGGGPVFLALLCSELARGSSGLTLSTYVHTALACSAILHLGDENQKENILPQALQGNLLGCWAYAEPGAGADVSSVGTRAVRDGSEYIIRGNKMYITNAPSADFAVVVASTSPEEGVKGLSLFVVEASNPGMEAKSPMEKLGMGATEMGEIVFDDCRVSEDARLGSEDTGFLEALTTLKLGRIAAASFAVGLGRAAYESALEYTREREQFGKSLTKQQFVRFTLADMAIRLNASWRLVLHAARLAEAEEPYDVESSMAKVFATETTTKVCERALHLCGAQGYMLESDVQRYYRDCKVLELGEGTNEILRENIGRSMGF